MDEGLEQPMTTLQFASGLLWIHEDSMQRRPGFPSWSWRSWKGPVEWLVDQILESDIHIATSVDRKLFKEVEESDLADAVHLEGRDTALQLIGDLFRIAHAVPDDDAGRANKSQCLIERII